MPADDGAARRALRMAAMSAGVSGSYIGYMVQRLFLGEEARDDRLRETHAQAARQVTGGLLSLRGPAMKLGQMLSLQSDLLPEEMIEELGRLQMEAPGMHPSLVRAQFRSSMGQNPEQTFARFDPKPFAAASLGQVHHAVTHGGDDVAVKIQYPGIGDAIASDFKLLRTLTLPARLSRYLTRDLLDELQTQIVAETDYVREAGNIDFFRTGLESLGFVSVPVVHRDLSGARVLTMSRLGGEHLDALLARNPPQELRDSIGANLMELYYFQLMRMQAFHADPHWGNYLFRDDGSIGLVDFGCVKYVPPRFVENLRKIFLYPGPRDSDDFRRRLEERYSLYGKRIGAPTARALVQFAERFYGRVYPPEVERAAEPLVTELAETLRDIAAALRAADPEAAEHALLRARALQIHEAPFAEAVAAGRETARLAPPRRRAREPLDAYAESVSQIDLAQRNTRVLARAALRALQVGDHVPPRVPEAVEALAGAAAGLTEALNERDRVDAVREHAARAAAIATVALEQTGNLSVASMVSQVRSTAVDLLRSTGLTREDALDAVRRAADEALQATHEEA